MSKKIKLLQRFLTMPPVKDFRWDDFVTLMDHVGFDMCEPSGGSSHKFFVWRGDKNVVINIHRPHPGGILWVAQIKDVKQKLYDLGVLKDE